MINQPVTFWVKPYYKSMKIRIWLCFILITWTIASQTTPIAMLRNSYGSGFFIDNESNQPAMLVRGFFCGNSYFYTPIGMGDSIKELYFALAPPFPPLMH